MVTLAAMLQASGAVERGQFVLASGKRSNVYIDIKKAACRPEILREIARAISAREPDAELLAGMELGAVPIVAAASLETGIPFLIVRKRAKEHGTGQRVEGSFDRGRRVFVIEDVTTSGGSVIETVRVLREAGLVVEAAVTVVDRDQGASAALAKVGVKLDALVSIKELLGGSWMGMEAGG